MTIAEARTSCKALYLGALARSRAIPRDILLVLVLLLASCAAFGLGILEGQGMAGQGGTAMRQEPPEAASAAVPLAATPAGQVVASRNGTKYYLPSCSGAARIAAANKITFASAAAAEAAGYSPAANCKGI